MPVKFYEMRLMKVFWD